MTFATVALVATLIVALVLIVLVVRLHRRLDQLAAKVRDLQDRLENSTTTQWAVQAPEPHPAEVPVPVITGLRATIAPDESGEPSAGRVVSVTLAGPMIKVAALSHGLRRALDDEHRMQIGYAFRKELRRQRKMRRRSTETRPRPKEGWRP